MGGFGSGRKPGSGGRQPGAKGVVTESMRKDILSVYRKLGGQKFLLSWARENKTEYIRQCLARVMPAAPREDAEPTPNIDTTPISLLDIARRISFILSSAEAAMPRPAAPPLVEMAPSHERAFPYRPEEPQAPLPPLDEAPVTEPSAIPKGDPLHDDQDADSRFLDTAIYRGTAAEQGRSSAKPEVIDQRRKAHGEYMARLAARRRDLL